MTHDTGTGWVRRWFAKPVDKGSIPSRVSIHNSVLDVPRLKFFQGQSLFWMGRRIGFWLLHAPEDYPAKYRSFRAGVLYPVETVQARKLSLKHNAESEGMVPKATHDALKAELIAARKQISALKRAK